MLWRLGAAVVVVFGLGLMSFLPALTNVWGAAFVLAVAGTAGVAVVTYLQEKTLLNTYLGLRYAFVGAATLLVVLFVPGGLLPLLLPAVTMATWPLTFAAMVLVFVGTLVGELVHLVIDKPAPVVEPTPARAGSRY